ncbi:ketosteroid isomerase [Streptomyces sp. SID3343]|nr:ketosteroid isomerase [Streptomyces sp. SID3343]
MLPAAGGDIAWAGHIVVLLDADGRIRRDYQFGVPITDQGSHTRAVVEEFRRRVAGGEPEHIAALFADEVDWQVDFPAEGHPATPWIRPRSTRADLADLFRELAAAHVRDERDPAVARTVVDGTDAVILTEIRRTAKSTGTAYTAALALRLSVEDGLITRYHVYEDSLTVSRAHTS